MTGSQAGGEWIWEGHCEEKCSPGGQPAMEQHGSSPSWGTEMPPHKGSRTMSRAGILHNPVGCILVCIDCIWDLVRLASYFRAKNQA